MFFVLLLTFFVAKVSTQACTAYENVSGTCKKISDCKEAHFSNSAPATSGCGHLPNDVQCCVKPSCTTNLGRVGYCMNTITNTCPTGRVSSTGQGATGCQRFPNEILCCEATGAGPNPTPRPVAATPNPTPQPVSQVPEGTASCTYRGVAGKCRSASSCLGVHRASHETRVCTQAGVPIAHVCCIEPPCTFNDHQGTINGVCARTSVTTCAARKQSVQGAVGCKDYPNEVTCCLPRAPVEAPTPRPGNQPCSHGGGSGICKTRNACDRYWVASGGPSCSGSGEQCCVSKTCTFQDDRGGSHEGHCFDPNYTPCNAFVRTTIAGATGCAQLGSQVQCCLDTEPQGPLPTPVPPPTPMQTPAPTPALPDVNGKCAYSFFDGECTQFADCPGVFLAQSNTAVVGCDQGDRSAGCCVHQDCTAPETPGSTPVPGVCHGKSACQNSGRAAISAEQGAQGCQPQFNVGVVCCVGESKGPILNEPQERFCSVPVDGIDREGTCFKRESCTGQYQRFFTTDTTGFYGCRNGDGFADLGCCVTIDPNENKVVPDTCTVGDSSTCRTAHRCVLGADNKPVCEVDPDFDCKELQGCVMSLQECAADAQGNWRCGDLRSCHAVGCPTVRQKCKDVGGGHVQCVDPEDCFSLGCQGGEVCRENPRGPEFAPQCGPAQSAVGPDTPGNSKNPGGLPTWLLVVIILLVVCVCIVLCLVIAAVIVAMTRDDDQVYQDGQYRQEWHDGGEGTTMHHTGTEFVRPNQLYHSNNNNSAYSQGGGYSFDNNGGAYGMGAGGGYTAEMDTMGSAASGAYPSGMSGQQFDASGASFADPGGYNGAGSYQSNAYPSGKAAF